MSSRGRRSGSLYNPYAGSEVPPMYAQMQHPYPGQRSKTPQPAHRQPAGAGPGAAAPPPAGFDISGGGRGHMGPNQSIMFPAFDVRRKLQQPHAMSNTQGFMNNMTSRQHSAHRKGSLPTHKRADFSKPDQRLAPKSNMFCSGCKRTFDLGGRSALLLECSHMLCQDCLSKKLHSDGLETKCSDCNQQVSLQMKVKNDFNIQDHFPVNFYVAGKLHSKRHSERNELASCLQFMPVAGAPAMPAPTQTAQSGKYNKYIEKCKGADCKEEATLRCAECEEVYCGGCSAKLHAAAKGLRQHRIASICMELCTAQHKRALLEFYCATCAINCCSYCIIEQHTNHQFKQFTKLDPDDVDKFGVLLENCKEVLKKLQRTHKIVNKKVYDFEPKQPDKNLEKTIVKHFNELHGKLQKIEANLLRQAASATNATRGSLEEVQSELGANIERVMDLIVLGEGVMEQQDLNAGQNIALIMQRMENAAKLPHSLATTTNVANKSDKNNGFEFIDFTPDLASHFKLNKKSTGTTFRLVAGEEAVESCNSSILDEHEQSDTSSVSEITIGSKASCSVKINSGDQEYKLRRANGSNLSIANSSIEDITQLSSPHVPILEESRENVIVTNIISPVKFHVQLMKQFKNLQNLQRQLKYHVDTLLVGPVQRPRVGKQYLGRVLNGIAVFWRRVLVLEVFAAREECLVRYIDFGSNETLGFNDLREITEELSAITPYAYECKLYDITEPASAPWTEEDATLMANMLNDASVTMIVKNVEQNMYEVDLKVYSASEEFFLRNSLLFLGRAACSNDVDEAAVVSVATPSSDKKDKLKTYNEHDLPKSGEVVIVSIVDAITLYVRNTSANDFYQGLTYKMTDFYKKLEVAKPSRIYSPQVGAPVAVKELVVDDAAGLWHRALVLDVQQGAGTVTVLYVDAGREATVSYESIRAIHHGFLSNAKLATKVHLAQVNYQNAQQNQAGVALLSTLMGKPLKMLMQEQKREPEVMLFEVMGTYDLCINTQLVQQAGLRSTGFITSNLKWEHEEKVPELENEPSITTSLMNQSQGTADTDDDDDGVDESVGLKLVAVKVVHIESPDCIFIHPEQEEFNVRLSKLDLKFQKHHGTRHFVTRDDWQVNDTCAAYNKQKHHYCRARIVRRVGERYEVIGLDYGTVFEVTCDAMGEMGDEFQDLPPMALKVSLYGIKPMGKEWTLTARDYLRDMIVGKPHVFITRLKAQEATARPVVIWTRKAKPVAALERSKVITRNVNRQICKVGLGMLSGDWSLSDELDTATSASTGSLRLGDTTDEEALKPTAGAWLPAASLDEDSFTAISTYVDEKAHIYFHYTQEQSALSELEEAMLAHFQHRPPEAHVVWEVGHMCTVRYHVNKKFYRGEVVGVDADEEELHVRMIDYGNVEACNYNEVWREVLFVEQARVAKVLRLHDFRAGDMACIPTSILDALHSLVVDKVIDVEIMSDASSRRPASARVHQGKINVNAFLRDEMRLHEGGGGGGGVAGVRRRPRAAMADVPEASDDDVIIEEVIRGKVAPASLTPSPNPSLSKRAACGATSSKPLEPLQYKHIDLPSGEHIEVYVLNAVGTDRIVFDLTIPQEDNSKFDELQLDINEHWREQRVLAHPQERQACIAQFSEDGVWYRAQILMIDSVPNVFFVDFGNSQPVAKSEVREAKAAWLQLPVLPFLAVLSDFHPFHILFTDVVKKHLDKYIETHKLARITCRQPLAVQLFDRDTKKLAYEELMGPIFKRV